MKQHELGELVEKLAEAERTAAQRIREAEEARGHRLELLRHRLEQQHRQETKALATALEQETRAQNEQLEVQARENSAAADRRIKRMKQRHEQSRSALIQWLVARVTPP